MLENKPVVRDVEKLATILLMDADFNFLKKLFIGIIMIKIKYKAEVIPMDFYIVNKGHTILEAGLNKNLVFGLSRMRIWDP